MSSTFFGLTIGYSGLNAFHASINTTANNISNVDTEGYSKQTVNKTASSALRVFQSYGSVSTGVDASSVTQLRDQYYDIKYWTNQSKYGFYERKNYYMPQIVNYFTDSASNPGFSRLFGKLFNAIDEMNTSAGDTSARNQVTSNAQKLMTYFNSTATQLQELQGTVNDEIKSTVDNINSIAQKIALMNKQINVIEMQGGQANDLRDSRALLIDELSQIVSVEVNEDKVVNSNYPNMDTGATTYSVKINGQLLVDDYEYNTLSTVSRKEKHNQSDIDGLYDVVWTNSQAKLDFRADSLNGSLKALFEFRDGNDEENLKGTCSSTTGTSITITSPTITEISKMNLPESGTLMVNNKEYTYSSFTAETDADENIVSYTFQLDSALTNETQSKINGMKVTVGETVNFKGIPYYQNQMNMFLRSFARAYNDIEESGVDLNGEAGQAFFVAADKVLGQEDTFTSSQASAALTGTSDSYYRLTALNASVHSVMEDPNKLVTTTNINNGVDSADLVDDLLHLESGVVMFRGSTADKFLQTLYADITVDAQESSVFASNYKGIQTTIDKQRQSVSGVDEDEEAMDLVKFLNAYNLCSKVISVMAEMYDQLILSTAV